MLSRRAPMPARTRYVLAGTLVLGLLAAATVSGSESRQDFIIRQEVGEFDFRGPNLDAPDLDGPDVDVPDGPDIDAPNIDGPNIDGPALNIEEIVRLVLILVVVVGLIIGLILLLSRFSAERKDDGVQSRTSRLEGGGPLGATGPLGDSGWAAFERFCYELLQDPDPSRAVRVVMRYAEAGLGRLESRIADETPNEWVRRTRTNHRDLADHLEPIVKSYNSVRFGGAGASPAERDSAVDGLRHLARAACGSVAPETPGTAHLDGGRP